MTHTPLLRVFMNGGYVAPADLERVMEASEAAGNRYVLFSSRQDILFPASGRGVHRAADVLRDAELCFSPTSLTRLRDPLLRSNIVSSYAAVNVVETTWWLTEDVYEYTLAHFDDQPRLKVHVVDPLQGLVPLFGGHVHFVASSREHYWHLYSRVGDETERMERFPGLVHGEDLAHVTRALDDCLLRVPDLSASALTEIVRSEATVADVGRHALKLPNPLFPYYEGLNPMSNDRFWLGLYWRNNQFDIPFLREACRLCRETRIAKISLTPWKSFLIKGIRSEDVPRWERLMGRFGINTRHSSLELNWHIPVLDAEALELKNGLVSELTMRDISTRGLTFTVKGPEPTLLFTSVVIEREARDGRRVPTYTIRHTRDFDPNRPDLVTFAHDVMREELPGRLVELSRLYAERGPGMGAGGEAGPRIPGGADVQPGADRRASARSGSTAHDALPLARRLTEPERRGRAIRQCLDCLTIYDPAFGDPAGGIDAGTPFSQLPDEWSCPVCAADLGRFAPLPAVPA